MITLLVIVIVCFIPFLTLPVSTQAQSDPLNSAYKPTIDTNPSDYPANIWITDTMRKVRQDSGSPGSAHWGTFYGTQNEFVDFQVHFHDTGSGTANLSVTVSNFVQAAPSSFTISSNIIVYREAYMDVTGYVTSTASTYYGAQGYYPDILIPAVDPYYHQTTNAWPFTVAAGNNQSAWVDVLIPPTAPSGYYLGSVTVKSGSTTLATMPVILAVWQWPSAGHMPSTATLQSTSQSGWDSPCIQFYGSAGGCAAYPGSGGNADQGVTNSIVQMAQMLLDHRYSAINPIYPPYQTTFTGLQTYFGPTLTGSASTMLSGAKVTTTTYAPINPPAYVQNWETEWVNQGYTSTLFDYSCDEPPAGCAWSTITSNATSLHASTPPMPALVTTDLANATTNGVLNSIDIMVPIIDQLDPQSGGPQRSTYNTWLAGSSGPARLLWSYQSCEESGTCTSGQVGTGMTYPNYDVDGLPAANRAMEWMSYRNQVSGELYYLLNYAWTASNDPWTSVYFFGGWGDGTLIYPSTGYNGTTLTNHVTNSSGGALTQPIFLPSIRFEHIRDGMQDYEYLNVLTNKGKGALVTTEVNSWITNSYTFETTGSGLEAARMALGTAMQQLTYPPVALLPPTGLSVTAH